MFLQGLEFDDVFLVDFFSDSPASAEWRVLMSYLQHREEECGGLAASGRPLQQVNFMHTHVHIHMHARMHMHTLTQRDQHLHMRTLRLMLAWSLAWCMTC